MTVSPAVVDPPDQLLNFRDLGGLRAAGGRQVRAGVLFRSDDLGVLSPAAWLEVQRRLQISTAIDFRSEFEDDQVGGLGDDGPVARHHVPILDGSMVEAAHANELSLMSMYDDITFEAGHQLACAVSILGRPEALPAIVFCTAGKDRTGILVALLLATIGVERDDIVADFVRSAAVGPALLDRFAQRFGPDEMPPVPPDMLEAPPEAIISVLDSVDDRFGSAASYFVDHGADPESLNRLQRTLLA